MSLLFVNTSEGKGQLVDLRTKSVVCSYNTGNSYRYACCYCPHVHLIALHHIRKCAFFLSPHHQQIVQRSFTTSVITSCAVTLCGTFMIAGSDSGHLFVWNVRTGELIKNCKAHLRAITCIALSHVDNNALVATSSADAECKVWTLASLVQPHHTRISDTAAQNSFTFTDNYKNANSLYDTHNHNEDINANNGGDNIMYSNINMENEINVDVGTITPLSVCTTHTLSVEVCTFMHQTNYVWTGSSDKTCCVFDARTGHVLYTWTVGESVSTIAIADNDAYCVIGTTKGTILIRSLTSPPNTFVQLTLATPTSQSNVSALQEYEYYFDENNSSSQNKPSCSNTHNHYYTSNTESDMSEPIVIAPSADGHHTSIVHLSFVHSFTDKNCLHSINNNMFTECNQVLSVSENGSILVHDLKNGKLCGDKISLPRMKIASCCIVPERGGTRLLRKETELKKTFKGLSKNTLDLGSGGGSNGCNDMTLVETVQVFKVHGNINSVVKEYQEYTMNKHMDNSSKIDIVDRDEVSKPTVNSEQQQQQQHKELEQLNCENAELEELKRKLELKLSKALKRTRPSSQSMR